MSSPGEKLSQLAPTYVRGTRDSSVELLSDNESVYEDDYRSLDGVQYLDDEDPFGDFPRQFDEDVNEDFIKAEDRGFNHQYDEDESTFVANDDARSVFDHGCNDCEGHIWFPCHICTGGKCGGHDCPPRLIDQHLDCGDSGDGNELSDNQHFDQGDSSDQVLPEPENQQFYHGNPSDQVLQVLTATINDTESHLARLKATREALFNSMANVPLNQSRKRSYAENGDEFDDEDKDGVVSPKKIKSRGRNFNSSSQRKSVISGNDYEDGDEDAYNPSQRVKFRGRNSGSTSQHKKFISGNDYGDEDEDVCVQAQKVKPRGRNTKPTSRHKKVILGNDSDYGYGDEDEDEDKCVPTQKVKPRGRNTKPTSHRKKAISENSFGDEDDDEVTNGAPGSSPKFKKPWSQYEQDVLEQEIRKHQAESKRHHQKPLRDMRLFTYIQRVLEHEHGIVRTPQACKNQWGRVGREKAQRRGNIDEREQKAGVQRNLVTSAQ